MAINSADYWRKYNQLRLNAKEWKIDYARYTHAQIQQAIELNGGKINAALRLHLNIMPPLNAFYAAKAPQLAEPHLSADLPQSTPMPQSRPQPPPVSAAKRDHFDFRLPAPKESSGWSQLPAL